MVPQSTLFHVLSKNQLESKEILFEKQVVKIYRNPLIKNIPMSQRELLYLIKGSKSKKINTLF